MHSSFCVINLCGHVEYTWIGIGEAKHNSFFKKSTRELKAMEFTHEWICYKNSSNNKTTSTINNNNNNNNNKV